MADLKGKVAVITGAASGIGLAGVETFIAAGAKVIAGDIQMRRAAPSRRASGRTSCASCTATSPTWTS